MSRPTLVFVSPHSAGSAGLPTRPASLLGAFVDAAAFADIVVVNRLQPGAFIRRLRRGWPVVAGSLVGISRRLSNGALLIEHPWPFGRLERRFLGGLLASAGRRSAAPVVAWVADPKSVPAVLGTDGDRRRWCVVFDAYDAWDRSPLVVGDRRRRAVSNGYRAAAAAADLVFANTAAMRDRLADLGARDARLLPNACPPVALRTVYETAGRRPSGLVYVGRIHERFDAELAGAVAAALPAIPITIAGPLEREPAGWSALTGMSNVRLPGRMEPAAARALIGDAAALIVPHLVDDYTRSQDAMKAWDAIASGTPVISTPVPPVDGWPVGLAQVCPDAASFIAAARRAVDGDLEAGRADRRSFALENQWSNRAAVAISAIEGLLRAPNRRLP